MAFITQIATFAFFYLAVTCQAQEATTLQEKDLGAIWFIGDSITQSNADGDQQGSPRKSLYDLLKTNGYAFTYTGHHTKNPDGLCADQTEYAPEAGSDAETKKGKWAITADPDLPNVLILGDSISIGYTLPVRAALKGKANVFRPCTPDGKNAENCQGTKFGIQKIDHWLAGQQWDVIHFNWGLHDLKHVKAGTDQNSISFDDPQQADPAAYEKNLQAIVDKLKATGAELVFATTTPYPDGVSPARLPADAKLYNGIALKIMEANHIEVNDLYALTEGRLKELQLAKNVHFNPKGNQELARQVVNSIENELRD